jgi:putative nucleotidyltransferase with HDIG domain
MDVLSHVAARFVSAAIAAGAAVVAYSAWDLLTSPIDPLWVVLLALTVASGLATLRIPSMPISFSISDTFNIIAALLVGPSAGAINAAVDGLVLSSRMSSTRRTIPRVLFNMAVPAIATWLAAQVFVQLAGRQPAMNGVADVLWLMACLTLFGLLVFGCNTGLVAMAVGLESRQPIVATWKRHFSGLWVTFFGGVIAAMLMLALSTVGTLQMLLLIVPLPVLLHVTFKHALGRAEDKIQHLDSINKVYFATIEALAQAIDAKDQVTHDHIRRVQGRSVRLARSLGVEDEGVIQAIKAASLLHDVGKLAIPEHILNKPGRLSPSEYEIMKRHAAVGSDILGVIGFPYPVAPIVRHHHENWDGSGYPDGLVGEQIPIGARILMVVDCFDALTSDRPYRPRIDDAAALQVLEDRKGTMYDPRVVDGFADLYRAESADVQAESASSAALADVSATIPILSESDSPATAPGDGESELHAFYALGRALRDEPDLARLGQTLWHHLQRHLPATSFVLFVYDPPSDGLVPAYQSEHGPHRADEGILLGERLSGWVAATRQAVVNAEARLDLEGPLRDASALRSALAVPVTAGGRAVGVLTFYAEQTRAFDERHRRIAEAAAMAAAEHFPVSAAASAPAEQVRNGTRVS